ncbi:hypothetical protein [Sphingomonas abietis]|uniref:Restriction endonuclease n=1 Tax=Sphingomonas abietis TaxID=3012344 RepID=A0ABY7NU39_9SPHN|nr:hypothetical protein [Sphingomonas abietis]WBO23956.1 hypothetical protein PBT88_07555 [Sphingomonas abietis]
MSAAQDIAAVLRRTRMPSGSEASLQIAIGEALGHAGIDHEREKRLGPADRIDFLCAGGVGIEAKVKYPKRAIYRQLERYAAHDEVTALIIVTATAIGMPAQLNCKPVFYVSIGRASL